MLFQQSAVTEITAWECVEAHPGLPLDIHPAYLGSGPVAFALDATGMQGLDARQMEAPESVSMTHTGIHLTDDLHIYHAATLSQHHRSEGIRFGADMSSVSVSSGQLPAGYFDYVLTLDGARLAPADLARAATDWRRRTRPGQGVVLTGFRLRGVELEWAATIERRSNRALFNLTVRSLDGAPHTATLAVRVHLATRWGADLARGGITTGAGTQFGWCHWQAEDATSTAPLKQAYEFAWGVAMDRPVRTTWTAPTLVVAGDLAVPAAGVSTMRVALHLGCSQTQTGAPPQTEASLRAFLADPATAWEQARTSWETYFERSATFSIGVPQIEYLYHHSQYLLAAGGDWDWGLPANFLWNHNWAGAVFWDTFFATDGMLRAGHTAEVRRFLPWLARIAGLPGERPFYFMHDYDGARTREDDQAYQVLAAHAGSALRYYEATGDEAALREWVYPVLKRVATYTRRHLVTLRNGQWRFSTPVANDIGVAAEGDANETGILVWLITAMAKAVEYGQTLGESEAVLASWREVVEAIRRSPCDWSLPKMWWLWLPYLTAGEPFYRLDSWREGVLREQVFVPRADRPVLRFVDGTCPWFQFAGATSMFQAGLPDVGWELVQAGCRGVYGAGVFSEMRYDHMQCVHNAPFMAAHGAYLSALSAVFVNGTVWDRTVRVFDALPLPVQRRAVSFRRIRSLNGACVSGAYTLTGLEVEIETPGPRPLVVGVPARLRGVPLAVTRNGERVTGQVAADGRTMALDLPAGTSRITLTEDRSAAAPVILFEPKARAAVFQQVFAAAGLVTRLVRDPRGVAAALTGARVLVLPSSIVAVPVYLAQAVEDFVQRGGCLVALHHAGCVAINPRLAALLGVNGETEDRFQAEFGTIRCALAAPHPLTAGLPGSFVVAEADRIKTPRLAPDVTVLAVNADTGDGVATVRAVGANGGCAIWLAPGQDQAGRQARYQDLGVEELRLLNVRIDETFSYPYLEDVPLRQLLTNAARYGLRND